MKRPALVALVLAFFTSAASAVPVTFTIGAQSFSTTITAQNAARALAWATAAYPTIPNPAYDPACTQSCAPATLPNPNPVQSALAAVWQGIKNNVIASEHAASEATLPTPGDLN